jgi:hypothetical protein
LLTKLLPLTVSVNAALSDVELEGLKLLITGTGLTTVVLNVALLLLKSGSIIALLTLAVWLVVPVVAGVPTSVTVALAPLLRVPKLQVIILAMLQVP